MEDAMTAMVLVHGAWGGSYGFRKVRPHIWGEGHEVYTPSLTGIGERSHLTSPMITLSTHIRDVVNTVLYEDLDDIVLLGFSYGGMVVTGTLDHIGDRVSHVVYLDAFVPDDGMSATAIRNPGAGTTPIEIGEAWHLPPIPRPLPDPDETAWSDARRTMQPVGTLNEPVHLSKPLEQWAFTRSYIKATEDPGEAADSAFWACAERAKASADWKYHEIPTNHLVASTHPKELAEILLALVS